MNPSHAIGLSQVLPRCRLKSIVSIGFIRERIMVGYNVFQHPTQSPGIIVSRWQRTTSFVLSASSVTSISPLQSSPSREKVLSADSLFRSCMLNIWAALVTEADWEDQAPLFNSSVFVNEKVKGRNCNPSTSAFPQRWRTCLCLRLGLLSHISPPPCLSHIYLVVSSALHLHVGVSEEETAFSCKLAHFSHFDFQKVPAGSGFRALW